MNIDRKKIRKMILQEMDMMDMGSVSSLAVSVIMILGPISMFLAAKFLDLYMQGLFSHEDMLRIRSSEDPEAEMGKVMKEKNLERGFMGVPRRKK